ncbi:hypothetical protein GCM10007913_08190 [Devosia yakushimensis]|uniref:DUF5680 domain-containing protein n=1 Tax=Devosia yakushimensis TaxID=470028 RepID=A0ABQ5U9S0_9HYPH|nr:DUF5680 domain-containing protein [Devosia yakushimensis]GLQ08887.1 hypothetical protein GCM10007913_08190 [Devosia yakushimensis]
MNLKALNTVIVAAKQASYVGGGEKTASSRQGSYDLVWSQGAWRYRDSYFGGTDFLGQETVWLDSEPVWAMNYHGFILRPDLIDAVRAGETIKAALSAMYAEGRFLGGFRWLGAYGEYVDKSEGGVELFSGEEEIYCERTKAYGLRYSGGLIKP